MSNIPTSPSPVTAEDMAKQQAARNTEGAPLSPADLAFEAGEAEDDSRLEAIDAITRGKLKP